MPTDLFYKTTELSIQKAEGDKPEVWTSVLSSTNVDLDGERMSTKALNMAAGDLLKNSTVFFNHKHHELPVAKIIGTEVTEKDGSHYLVVHMQPSMADGCKDVVTQVREGVLKCMSIGGKTLSKVVETVKDASGEDRNITVLDEIKALEGSIVGIGANPDAMIFGKSLFAESLEKDSYPDDNRSEGVSEGKTKVDMSGGCGKPPVVPKGKKKLGVKCPSCGELHLVKCPCCNAVHPNPDGNDAEIKSEGGSMTLVKCSTCSSEFPMEKNFIKEPEEEEEEEEDEEEKKKKKFEEKKKEVEVETEKEVGPHTPNDPALGGEPKADLYDGKGKKGKKPAVPAQSGGMNSTDAETHGPKKSVEEENLELKEKLVALTKSIDELKGVVYTRKSVVEVTSEESSAKPVDRYETVRKDILKSMNIEE